MRTVFSLLMAPQPFVSVRSTLVKAAAQALLAAFLVDEGRLPAFLAEVAHGLLSRKRKLPDLPWALDLADVLGQRPGDRVRQRENLRSAKAHWLSTADT